MNKLKYYKNFISESLKKKSLVSNDEVKSIVDYAFIDPQVINVDVLMISDLGLQVKMDYIMSKGWTRKNKSDGIVLYNPLYAYTTGYDYSRDEYLPYILEDKNTSEFKLSKDKKYARLKGFIVDRDMVSVIKITSNLSHTIGQFEENVEERIKNETLDIYKTKNYRNTLKDLSKRLKFEGFDHISSVIEGGNLIEYFVRSNS